MYEEYTYEKIMADIIAKAPEDIDTREGSIFWDATSPAALKIAELYQAIEYQAKMALIYSATGEDLDDKASEYGVIRLPATPAKYYVTFEGTIPLTGERFLY